MNKLIQPCTITEHNRTLPVFCEIEYNNGKLSITGVISPTARGDADNCGQIDDYLRSLKPSQVNLTPGWTRNKFNLFLTYWDKWHLNDMHAECEHQEELGWNKEPIDPSKPTNAYGKHHPDQTHDTWNLKMWERAPIGYMMVPCPICGYKLGSAWTFRAVPEHVIKVLFSLPDAPHNMPGSWGRGYQNGWDTLVKKVEVQA